MALQKDGMTAGQQGSEQQQHNRCVETSKPAAASPCRPPSSVSPHGSEVCTDAAFSAARSCCIFLTAFLASVMKQSRTFVASFAEHSK